MSYAMVNSQPLQRMINAAASVIMNLSVRSHVRPELKSKGRGRILLLRYLRGDAATSRAVQS